MQQSSTLHQLSPETVNRILFRIEQFNRGRTDENGVYAISMATAYRPYYALWRIFRKDSTPLFIRTLAVTLDKAADRAFSMLQNCNIMLITAENSRFELCYGLADDVIPFGKYRGKRLAEIFYIDPSYILWLANKFTSNDKRYERLTELAKGLAVVHFELTVQKRKISSVSRYVGAPGQKLKDLYLTVLNIRLQTDFYKPDFYIDQNILAVDRDGNRYVFLVKAAGRSLSPDTLSCHSRKIEKQETLRLSSAKVLSHYETHGVRYTRLGYVKFT